MKSKYWQQTQGGAHGVRWRNQCVFGEHVKVMIWNFFHNFYYQVHRGVCACVCVCVCVRACVCVCVCVCACVALPDQCVDVVLHQCGLVHGPQPGVHVLLGVSTEVICPHPSVLCLRANHRALLVNVRAHTSVASL